jgi:hypothetical protein
LAACISRLVDRGSNVTIWQTSAEQLGHTFTRFAIPITWDFAELEPQADSSGGFIQAVEWVAEVIEHAQAACTWAPPPAVIQASAISKRLANFDVVITDPPYYDAIAYSDLMDFFYIWLRRTLHKLTPEIDVAFEQPLSPKWNHQANDGELIDDLTRFGGDKNASKRNYEDGMARVFAACYNSLKPIGRMVVVFAHKRPDAWETLVAAIIRAGFVVDSSWPIQTERETRTRAISSAALSSSIWLVCKKRDPMAKAGWDTQVLKEMERGITTKLRNFWDAGIRGPDFVWAATGPALESFSRYPIVKKISESGQLMTVFEFLGIVRRIVVDFVVGRALLLGQNEQAYGNYLLDDITTYYLLHRYDFGLKEAPASSCILYAISCNLSERELISQYDILAKSNNALRSDSVTDSDTDNDNDQGEAEENSDASSGGSSKFKLKKWNARKHRFLGVETASKQTIPLIDQIHKLMQLWVEGDVVKVNNYLDACGLRNNRMFVQVIQALIEQSRVENSADERSMLERLQNHLKSLGNVAQTALELE